MMNGKKALLLFVITFILLCTPGHVFATGIAAEDIGRLDSVFESKAESNTKEESGTDEEPDKKEEFGVAVKPDKKEESGVAAKPDTKEESGTDEESDADTASNAQELNAWVKAHERQGGALLLTGDITLDDTNQAWLHFPDSAPAVIDLDGHTITINGTMEMYIFGITIRGGGEKGLLRISPGSSFYLNGGTLEGEGGPVLWQEEGAFLSVLSSQEEGSIHFAEEPVAGSFVNETDLVIVEPGEDALEQLPGTVCTWVSYQGRQEKQDLPIQWDLADKEKMQCMTKRLRTGLTGVLNIPFITAPACTVVFRNQPITLTTVIGKEGRRGRSLYVWHTAPVLPAVFELQYSFDGVQFQTAGQDTVRKSYQLSQTFEFCTSDEFCAYDQPPENCLFWDTEQFPEVYIRLRWVDAPEQSDAYSDTIVVDGNTLTAASDGGGNRGGGTDIINPPDVPEPEKPSDSGESQNPGGVTEPEEVPEPGGATEPGEAASPGETPIPAETLNPGEKSDAGKSSDPEETPDPKDTDDTGEASKPDKAKDREEILNSEETAKPNQDAKLDTQEPEETANPEISKETGKPDAPGKDAGPARDAGTATGNAEQEEGGKTREQKSRQTPNSDQEPPDHFVTWNAPSIAPVFGIMGDGAEFLKGQIGSQMGAAAAGCAAVLAVVLGAGLYLHPWILKKWIKKLKGRRKQ